MKFKKDLLEIELKEKEILINLGWLFKNSINEFSTSMDRSLNYLNQIIFPTIMASKKNKSYNPFAEIIEKYTIQILTNKLEKQDYKFLPLSYSSDLTFENNDHILNIDIKTANLNNPSDFNKTINMGINQITHIAKLPLDPDNILKLGQEIFLPDPYFVYPSLPPYYKLPNDEIKLVLTYGLLFIYPSYRNLIVEITEKYLNLQKLFKNEIMTNLISSLKNQLKIDEEKLRNFLNSKSNDYSHIDIIIENIMRGIFIHKEESKSIMVNLNINYNIETKIYEFLREIDNFTIELRKKDIKPIAIIAIALPNGLLKEKYKEKFVSGKSYGKSARYHYKEGIFEVIKEKTGKEFPRVIFLDLNKKFKNELNRYFKIYKLGIDIVEEE